MVSQCKKCGAPAAVVLPYANVRYCKTHFIEFFENRIERFIVKYKMVEPGDRVLIAVSGGKDSVVLLHVMWKLADRLGIKLHGVTIDLGIRNYSSIYVAVSKKNFEKLGVPYTIIDLKDAFGFTIDDVAKRWRRVCAKCGIVKRYVLNKFAVEEGYDAVATGHNLDDMMAVALSSLMRGDVEGLGKIKPVLPAREGLVKKIKPLAFTREKDVKIYACLNKLDVVSARCPYSRGSTLDDFKHAINMLEEKHPSIKYSFARTLYREQGGLARMKEEPLGKCKICGMPSKSLVCGFCRLRQALQASPRDRVFL